MFQIKKEDGLYFVYKDSQKISIGFKDEGMAQNEVLNLSKDCPCPFKDKMFTQEVSFIDSLNTEKRTVISIRDGVQEYLGLELGLEPFDKVFKIYRSPETIRELKDKLVGIPLIENHIEPKGDIDESLKKGNILNSEEIENIDNSLDSTLAIRNEITLFKDKLEFNHKQLSLGYTAKTVPSAEYDFEQLNINPHHLAIVEAGRCGGVCEFKDEKGVKPMDLNELLAKLKEALVNASDADKALVLETLDGIIPKTKVVDSDPVEMEKKFEDAKKIAGDDAIKKFMDSQAFKDAMLHYGNDRASIIGKAKNFLDEKYDFKTKSNEVIMADVIKAEYPTESFKDAEIGVAFKLLKEREQQVSTIEFKDSKDEIIKAFNEEIK
ncbi:DUF2213 domain-containing protein [Aliarcobacter butzleri]|uniref:DUF2213 domain-containing protein n=1 Tax=Aliarcobacter butzleri TaxID=28197 RepID=UPI001EDC6A38|nr:DUF2213 domain-containing protein [Aliarcobacter butzleri]MCG3684076.1 DUF2213 domain-containing protein [Aliarcobacter butzleri]